MGSLSLEAESPVSAVRMYRAALLDWHNLGPKLVPEVIASGAAVEGDGGVGSIRQINFTPVMPFSYVKERLDLVDHENYECKSTNIVEGGNLGTKVESASAHFKLVPTSSGGCVCRMTATYKPLPGVDAGDEDAKAKEATTAQLKSVEAYLLANPTAYA